MTTAPPTTVASTTAPPTTVVPTTAPPDGTVCWGHDTGVVEDNVRDFLNNWLGDAAIFGIDDNEQLVFDSGEYMESETWYAGAGRIRLLTNKYIYVLAFDAQTGSFTAGNTITGATSGATATIVGVYQSGGTGYLYLTNIVGTFQDDEIIYESALGSELITNGDFGTGDGTGWTESGTGTATEDYTGNELTSTITVEGSKLYYQSVSGVASAYYAYSATIRDYNASRDIALYFHKTSHQAIVWMDQNTTYSGVCQANEDFTSFRVGNTNSFTVDSVYTIDDISLKQVTNAALANGAIAAFSEGTPVVKYKQGASQALCEADSWHAYTIPFVCGGWVKIRLECT